MKVAIIGAGWAGLSAAVELAEHAEITVFEASKTAGGRARALGTTHDDFSFLDNGQHLLIGAYRQLFGILNKVGVNAEDAFVRQAVQWVLHDGLRLQTRNLPMPLNLLLGFAQAQGADFHEKIALMRSMARLSWWRKLNPNADETVQNWLNREQIAPRWQDEFWRPLVLGALNTPLETASLRVLANVLNDGVLCPSRDSEQYFAKYDLGQIWVEPILAFLAEKGVNYVPSCRVSQLNYTENNQIIIENQLFDKVIIAVAPYHVLSILPEYLSDTPEYGLVQKPLSELNYHAITTVYLKYREPIQLPHIMTGFAHGTAQWLINRNLIHSNLNSNSNPNTQNNEIAAVISVSEQHGSLKPEEWIAKIHADVLRVCPNVSEPIAAQVITEKRATFGVVANRVVPDAYALEKYHIVLAGDYLHSDYPATLESAVQSGIVAAKRILSQKSIIQ